MPKVRGCEVINLSCRVVAVILEYFSSNNLSQPTVSLLMSPNKNENKRAGNETSH